MEQLIIIIILLVIGYFVGKNREKKHYESILEREKKFSHILVISENVLAGLNVEKSGLLTGNVVVAIDYFKRFVGSLVNIFGGRLFTYETLIDRARREAVLKIKEKAAKLGANALVNLRIETSSISKNSNKQIGAVEVLAYATGVIIDKAEVIEKGIIPKDNIHGSISNIEETKNIGIPNIARASTIIENYNIDKGSHLGKGLKYLIYLFLLLGIVFVVFLQISKIVVAFVSIDDEKRMFSTLHPFNNFNDELTQEVRDLVGNVNYDIYVVNEAQPNAFASLGGNLYITKGLFDVVHTEEELLFVIGHELSHIENRDVLERVATQVPFSVAVNLIVGDATDIKGVGSLVSNSYDKYTESIADEYGLSFLVYVKGHAGCAKDFFEKTNSLSVNAVEILSDHPTTQSRINNINNIIKEKGYDVQECTPLNF